VTENSRVRVSIVGVIVIALFSALLTRLWFLQVDTSATRIATEVNARSIRTVYYESPRGWIYDRNGDVIVRNRVTWVIKIDRRLTGTQQEQAITKLAELLDVPRSYILERLNDKRISPLEDALIAVDVADEIRTEISEHREYYPYIQVEQVAVREYPNGASLAAVLGYIGRVNQDDLDRHEGEYGARDTIGRAGIEAALEAQLRGRRASETVSINPAGEIIGDPIRVDPGKAGNDVYLTIDLALQQQVELSLAEGIAVASRTQNFDVAGCCLVNYRATSGAAVVLDARTGEVLAMASLPSYNPEEFVSGVTDARWRQLRDEEGDPLFNRATKSSQPAGSTFKLLTALAAVDANVRSVDEPVENVGCYRNVTGDQSQEFCNPGRQETGTADALTMRSALSLSSDTYFYEIGDMLWGVWKAGDEQRGDAIQHTARAYGFGEKTGIEIGEVANRVPDAQWRFDYTHAQADAGVQPYAGNVNEWDDWNPADNINLAVGQGDLTTSPLQLANAYATYFNGGSLLRPYLVREVLDGDDVVLGTEPTVRRRLDVPIVAEQAIDAGLLDAVSGGTAQRAFAGFPLDLVPVAGKTGTAQRTKFPVCADPVPAGTTPDTPEEVAGCKGDTSWFVAVAPAAAPEYVVVVMVEEGGFGGDIAAPVARQIFEKLYAAQLGGVITPVPDPPERGGGNR
jgi:penicillin-binding protein 2